MSDNDSLRPEDFERRNEPAAETKRGPKEIVMTIMREQPLIRLVALIVPVVLAVVVIISVFGSKKTVSTTDRIAPGSGVSDTNAGQSSNQNYNKALEEENKRKLAEAQAQGKDYLGVAPPTTKTDNDATSKDPLVGFNPVTVPVKSQVEQTATPPPLVLTQPKQDVAMPGPPPPPPPPPMKLDTALAGSFSNEMRTIIGGMNAKPLALIHVTTPPAAPPAGATNASNGGPGTSNGNSPEQYRKIIMAGTIIYGQTLIVADSDIPAPVLVNVLSGALQGGKAIGSFKTIHTNDDYLVLAFGNIIRGTKEYHVNAIAMDPDTQLTGIETDVDHHYFERFVLPAAAGFISGVGNYTQQAGSTVTYSSYGVSQSYPPLNTHQEILSGLGTGANAIANAIQQESNVEPTVYIAAGTGIGILFINSVREIPND